MPELPEVERARKSLSHVGTGNTIVDIVTYEDSIVFSGTTAEEFVRLFSRLVKFQYSRRCITPGELGKGEKVSRSQAKGQELLRWSKSLFSISLETDSFRRCSSTPLPTLSSIWE